MVRSNKSVRIWKAVAYLLNWPIWWLTRSTPRRRDRWVFGAWLGTSFSDNPRYFFEYMTSSRPEIECIWVTSSRSTFHEMRAAGHRVEMSYSLRGYLASATAGLAVVSGRKSDVNRYVCPPKVFNLWHGIPLKKIEHDSQQIATRINRTPAVLRLFPFHQDETYAGISASSEIEAENLVSAFQVDRSAVFVTGQPRNDALSREECRRQAGVRRILYAPTFRDHDPSGAVRLLLEAQHELETALATLDAELHVRLHPNTPKPDISQEDSRIVWKSWLTNSADIAKVLDDTDMIITDYSSIYLDFLLTQRPIIFFPFDDDGYLSRERGLYFDYRDDHVTPGPKCFSWSVVAEMIGQYLDSDDYVEARIAALDLFHQYKDGRNCERTFEAAQSLASQRGRVRG